MDVTISGRHVDVTDAMEKHVRDRVDRLPRLDDQILAVTVTLENDSGGEQVEVIAKCHRNILVTNARSHNMYESIDKAFAKLERRISRLHDKLIEKRSR
ncbi:MAG: ribosome hibernation-promoting factor, HPF/YfiA family [Candidatus Brocadiia bacterium]